MLLNVVLQVAVIERLKAVFRVHPQRSCKLGERRSPAKNGRGTPFLRVPPQFDH